MTSDSARIKAAFQAVRTPAPVEAPAPQVQARVRKGKEQPWQPVDVMAHTPLFARRLEEVHAVQVQRSPVYDPASDLPRDRYLGDFKKQPDLLKVQPGRPVVHGADALVATFLSVKVRFVLTRNKRAFRVFTRGGASSELLELERAVERAAPLILANLRGETLTCDDCTSDAVTVVMGGALACVVHAAEILP